MNTSGTGIFIEPQGSLLDALHERKAWLEQAMPRQPLRGHPPHCTVLFGNFGLPADWLAALHQKVGLLPVFALETDAWQEFPRDALAGGGHTIALRARLTPALTRLQQIVADCLSSFLSTKPETHPLADKEPFASSLRQFGFPFVGPHWIPHFTIGSPLVAPESPLLARLMSGSARHRFVVRSLSVWRVEGSRHERLHELALGNTPSQIR